MTYPHPESVPVPTRKQTELVWLAGSDRWHIKTACGQYTVAKYKQNDGTWKYAGWHYKSLIAFAGTAAAAQQVCAAHFGQESGK